MGRVHLEIIQQISLELIPLFTATYPFPSTKYFLNLGDGVINFPKFLQLMGQRLRQVDGEEELLEAFKVFDIDGDGFITAEELKQVIHENYKTSASQFTLT